MKKYILSDFYFFNFSYIFKVIFDLLALFVFVVFSEKIISLNSFVFQIFFFIVLLLVVLIDALKCSKEGVFFLKFLFDISIFLLLLIDPFTFNYINEFKRGLFNIIIISFAFDFIILIFHSLCYNHYFFADLRQKIKNKFGWID